MFDTVLKKIFGSANDRLVKKHLKTVLKINALESEFSALSDDALRGKTAHLKTRLSAGETLEDITVDAFALVREASKRVFGMRHFDVQMVGGLVLHNGMIAEMKTGEGKTLVATLPVYLNALSGKGVHVITVNDYLAKRDAESMGELYSFLGLSTGCIVHGLSDRQRREAYAADITYGTNSEFGFDYLRDNMKFRLSEMVQRPFNYVIVDEGDSILIDEARTPLIISGAAEDSSELYVKVNTFIPHLTEDDYEKDEKQRTVLLTDAGVEKLEQLLSQDGVMKGESLYDIQNLALVHHLNQALKAHTLFTRDVDYIVKDKKVIIIDEFTGRMMDGRRYSEGLHQALEAKEHVPIEQENQTLASITYQNFFRLYPKLAGMTGTGMTEAAEFEEIYKLAVVEIPTNVPVKRIDHDDEVYLTAREKYDALIKNIKECQERDQPVLVGTTSIEKSEYISDLLKKKGIRHNVLNARHHDKEALIIVDAGRPGAVTIATNMAGRGTDIKLGGNLEAALKNALETIEDEGTRAQITAEITQKHKEDEAKVRSAGGLYVIGTERHESRRVDNQLRGRSGRQGDPGASKFYLSMEDDLMRIFGGDRLKNALSRLGMKEGEVIQSRMISKQLEKAQQKVEARNFDIRKHLLKYDDVMNDQRKIVYEQRRELMDTAPISEAVAEMRQEVVETIIRRHIPENSLIEAWNLPEIEKECHRILAVDLPVSQWGTEEGIAESELIERIIIASKKHMAEKEQIFGTEVIQNAEKTLLLRLLDHTWKEHLYALDNLRQGINLRAYAQSNPLNEYKREAFMLFQYMMDQVREEFIATLSHFQSHAPAMDTLNHLLDDDMDFDELMESMPEWFKKEDAETAEEGSLFAPQPQGLREESALDINDPSTWTILPRNAPCPCGSGKKYKHCHGRI